MIIAENFILVLSRSLHTAGMNIAENFILVLSLHTAGMNIAENNLVVFASTSPGLHDTAVQKPGFWRQSRQLSKLLFAGPSGTSPVVMDFARHLGLRQEEMALFRLALLGWQLAVRDHSFHEVMVGVDGYGPLLAYPQENTLWSEAYNHLLPVTLRVRSVPDIFSPRNDATVNKYDLADLEKHLFGAGRTGERAW